MKIGRELLYQTGYGAYFLVRENLDPIFTHNPEPVFQPFTRQEAIRWAENKFSADRIEAMFGDIPEAGAKMGTMVVRIPEALKRTAQDAAARADLSLNAWVLQCMERCGKIDGVDVSEISDNELVSAFDAIAKPAGAPAGMAEWVINEFRQRLALVPGISVSVGMTDPRAPDQLRQAIEKMREGFWMQTLRLLIELYLCRFPATAIE
ncbi:MAG TPA: toxin-antitoxin system HicB family antitoxin [Alphaproteobacteria bacterium]|nr:toxin-antitoxin system HicB family antitoxin [Alphaproteobacteria bacterium]